MIDDTTAAKELFEDSRNEREYRVRLSRKEIKKIKR
jgi:hypothetical protein